MGINWLWKVWVKCYKRRSLECWSDGVLKKDLNPLAITPVLQYSNAPAFIFTLIIFQKRIDSNLKN